MTWCQLMALFGWGWVCDDRTAENIFIGVTRGADWDEAENVRRFEERRLESRGGA